MESVAAYCDRILRVAEITDWDGACNGLQVENQGSVTRIAAAVDASLSTVRKAIAADADLLLVHHGLFWGPSHPWTGRRWELIRELTRGDLAVYGSHLPLDVHPRLGNNARLAQALSFKRTKPFFPEKGTQIGVMCEVNIPRTELNHRLGRVLGGQPLLIPGGVKTCRRVGIVTGGAGAELRKAADAGVDTFITGEGPHWTYALAEDLGLNVFYGGHYATETFGVRALAEHLSRRFRVPWVFIDHPTGL
ncbi:MAG: Nif3-like dinuclear metal center hexameric protein [Verrucomicrobia bacterium]|nr:Nif3-like dinuclear metal center hexameric protein [Verrucomicrobiota bacterium]